MSLFEDPPFPRGSTYGCTAVGVTDSTYEGREYWVPDQNPNTGVTNSNRMVKIRCVRSTANSGVVIPGSVNTFDSTSDKNGQRMAGVTSAAGQYGYPADEYLPAGGVNKNDLYYIVVKGPCTCNTPVSPANSIAWGNPVGGIAAGCVDIVTPATGNIQFIVGKALGAITSGTQAPLRVDVGAYVEGG